MEGREEKYQNDLFFVCSLLEYLARKTNNHCSVVVNAIGKEKLQHLLDLADVFHSENLEKITDELIEKHHIETGFFDNISGCKYQTPSHWDIGKVYKRLIIMILKHNSSKNPIDALSEVYNSWISRKIENYESSMYYENPDYIYQSYLNGDVL
ncbi:MAG: hypothetical protein LBD45_00335 [Bacteroidales bacterium]|jgi:hypothetical protein|nr:hypothetical protein [Bacteroidales bacterium]